MSAPFPVHITRLKLKGAPPLRTADGGPLEDAERLRHAVELRVQRVQQRAHLLRVDAAAERGEVLRSEGGKAGKALA